MHCQGYYYRTLTKSQRIIESQKLQTTISSVFYRRSTTSQILCKPEGEKHKQDFLPFPSPQELAVCEYCI